MEWIKGNWQEVIIIMVAFNAVLYAVSGLLGKIAAHTASKADDKVASVIGLIAKGIDGIVKFLKGGSN